jgi:predicted dehydrogenase
MRYAVVGVGALGRHHARIAAGLSGVRLVAVVDPHEEQGRNVAEPLGVPWLSDYRELIGQVDAVSIAVPTRLHRPVAVDLLAAGVATLVEKPLAATRDDGLAIVAAAEQHGVLLQVGHIERFNPAFVETASRVDSPRYIRCERLSPYAFRSMDIGAIHDLMIHDLDLVLTLAKSRVTRVEAFGVCLLGGHEDAVQARLTFANGCVADLVANRVHPQFRRHLQVWSAGGCVDADLHRRQVCHYRPSARLLAGELPSELAQKPGVDVATLKAELFGQFIVAETPELAECDQLTAEIQSFVEAVRRRESPVVDGRAALAALDVAEQIRSCVMEHRWSGTAHGPVGPHVGDTIRHPRAA